MIEGVNIGHALIAGFLAASVFALTAYWLEGVFGFPRMDFGAMGLKYMGGDKPGWWFVGQASHHLVSMLLALVYAGAVFLNLEDETGLLNVVVLPGVWDANREVARRSVGVVIEGVVEYRDGVTNLVARRFHPWPDDVRDVRTRNWAYWGR